MLYRPSLDRVIYLVEVTLVRRIAKDLPYPHDHSSVR